MSKVKWELIEQAKKRVNELFKRLRQEGYIAKQAYLCCRSCALHDLWQRVAKLGTGAMKRYVFYSRQSVPDLMRDAGVWLSWGAIRIGTDPTADELDAAGQRIVEIAQEVGLDTEWDGNSHRCIWVYQSEPDPVYLGAGI